ncbi:MAG: Uncharacterized protein G01um101416_1018 [Microgenomates group bacterium Gr01-1014_16]|nr:MAG: Uncharacterized protein G01um101416_1018 [Microgenomates group bacterium Gr01-1014_16]
MTEKITGYLLLTIGLLTICLSAFNIYQVFTKQIEPTKLFSGEGIKVEIPGSTTPSELVSADYLNYTSNLTVHYLLMSFLVSVGFKISSLGVQLLRPIEVKLSTSNSTKSI